MEIFKYFIDNSTNFILDGGILYGFFSVFIECFIPALPLSVFVALNVNAFGFFGGCLISWIATSLGSFICYICFSYLGSKFTDKFLNRKIIKKIKCSIDKFSNIKFTELVLLITLPFTPSFLINILSGLTKISVEKYVCSLLIGKVFSVIFWGYIGKSILESPTDIYSIVYIIFTLVLSYIISKIVSYKFKIN